MAGVGSPKMKSSITTSSRSGAKLVPSDAASPLSMTALATSGTSNTTQAKEKPPSGAAGASNWSSTLPMASRNAIRAPPMTSMSENTTPSPWLSAGAEGSAGSWK